MSTFTLNPQSAGNHEHIQQWIDHMATTHKPQCTGHLTEAVEADESGVTKQAYCCLGLGSELMGLQPLWPEADQYDVLSSEFDLTGHNASYAGYEDLAPAEFVIWLGLADDWTTAGEYDLHIDVPNAKPSSVSSEWRAQTNDGLPGTPLNGHLTASVLNDSGFTFAQIAQTIAYFGLRRV